MTNKKSQKKQKVKIEDVFPVEEPFDTAVEILGGLGFQIDKLRVLEETFLAGGFNYIDDLEPEQQCLIFNGIHQIPMEVTSAYDDGWQKIDGLKPENDIRRIHT
jgi:hypothetical protein